VAINGARRQALADLIQPGYGVRPIARVLVRSPATVGREVLNTQGHGGWVSEVGAAGAACHRQLQLQLQPRCGNCQQMQRRRRGWMHGISSVGQRRRAVWATLRPAHTKNKGA
jgi:hypothetical protein